MTELKLEPKTLKEIIGQLPPGIQNMKVDHAVIVLNPTNTDEHEILRFNTSINDAQMLFAWLSRDGNIIETVKPGKMN